MLELTESETGLKFRIENNVLKCLLSHRQLKDKCESGGLLFSNLAAEDCINITEISTPSFLDIRNKFFFNHNKINAQKRINTNFKKGLHYIGDWHSHPEEIATPSNKDIESIKDIFRSSKHKLNFMIHIIIGQSKNPNDIYMCITDGNKILRCSPNLTHENIKK